MRGFGDCLVLKRLSLILILAMMAVSAVGCLGINGSTQNRMTPTVGQQLMDLQTAHDKGAINDAEYEATKQRLLHSAGETK